MRVGVFQFHGGGNMSNNFETIVKAIGQAAKEKVRLLVFQECALCGYPPVEVDSVSGIDFQMMKVYFLDICRLAKENDMYIALGTIRKEHMKVFNSIQVINSAGELIGNYDKKALWGWDSENFVAGESLGVFTIDDTKVGFRICFDVRFPEYFRELFRAKVELCFVSFCDVAYSDETESDVEERYNIIKANLSTRAAENVMTIVSVNSLSKPQAAPTGVFDQNGCTIEVAPKKQEYLLVYDYKNPEMSFGAKGRHQHSAYLLNR